MKLLLVLTLALGLTIIGQNEIFAEKNTFFDSIKFIQYLDENTALEEVRNGNLDMYYYRIPSDRLENAKSREGLNVFDAAAGSYSILVNPAETEKFNPFSIREVRFSLNYLVDRKLIVNELMSGYGAPQISNYGPFDPSYLSIIEQLENFNFRYNPSLAEEIIEKSLSEKGATKNNDKWIINGEPIEIIIFIRSDDPVRKSIGEILASELEKIGFTVKKDYGDLNKAFVIVYGSDPAELKWNLYTEGWNKSAFVKYDAVGLGQMYAPWFGNMPGNNVPEYWNYQNDSLDDLTQKIYSGDFRTKQELDELFQKAVVEGVNESVRIFLASKVDQYVVNEKVEGVVNDFGTGIPSRFTPINSRSDKNELVIGVKQIYQGAWNPIGGLSDSYSRQIWSIISDPVSFPNPFTGEVFPVRGDWKVESAGPDGKLDLPDDAIIWDSETQQWKNVSPDAQATSKVTFDLKFSKWHNDQEMDMNDILYSLYFTEEWGTQTDENDKTFDPEITPRYAQAVDTIIGIRPIDEDTIEVYVDFWHFDESEIADWAALWTSTPWEILSSMERGVIDGKIAFSRSVAASKDVNWVSLIIPNDAELIQNYIEKFKNEKFVPPALKEFEFNSNYFDDRYSSSIQWISKNHHAVISNGPYYLKSYSPESRSILVSAFDDDSYPFKKGHWKDFENTEFPEITNVQIPKVIQKNQDLEFAITSTNADSILYFLNNNQGKIIDSDTIDNKENFTKIKITSDKIQKLEVGANDLKIFALSNSVLKPDYYSTSFLVSNNQTTLPTISQEEIIVSENEDLFFWIILPIVIVVIILLIYFKKKNS